MTSFASHHLRILLMTCFVAYPAVSGMPVLSKPVPGSTYITTRNTIAYTTSVYTPPLSNPPQNSTTNTAFCPAFVNQNSNGSATTYLNGDLPGCGNDDYVLRMENPNNISFIGCAWPEPDCPAGFTVVGTKNMAEPQLIAYDEATGTYPNVVCVTTAVCKSP